MEKQRPSAGIVKKELNAKPKGWFALLNFAWHAISCGLVMKDTLNETMEKWLADELINWRQVLV